MKVQNGQQYNRLTIVKANSSRKNGRLYSLCKCTCGTVKEVLNQNITGQHTFSCGCWNRERASERMKNKRPYSTKTRLYGIWKNIRRRTRNDNVHGKGYFDRGIRLCQEWHDYAVFREWALNNGYDDVLTLDRIDNDGNYCPENCRWTDQKTQCNNKRNNHFVTFKGKTLTMAQWAEELNVSYNAIKYRVKKGLPLC